MLRCEDCLPLIEEYFDGEVEETTAARVGAHLSACATCAAALDALSFEQEIYARYDRRFEVTPDLWSRVSAQIARDSLPAERPDARRPFLTRVREQLAACFGALAARPALASSLALILVGVAVGSLWLARRRQTAPAVEVAVNTPAVGVVAPPLPPAIDNGGGTRPEDSLQTDDSLNTEGSLNNTEGSLNDDKPAGLSPVTADATRAGSREPAAGRRTTGAQPAAQDDLMALLASAPAPQTSPGIVVIRPDEHAGTDDTAALFVNVSAPARDAAATAGDAGLLDPAEKEVARHVEQAQMLLRSIKNARASETGSVDVAYEKNLSRKLLAQNATLQMEAEVKGDKETKRVLDQIEPFLLDIANLRENPSRDEVRSIRERVRKNEIVAALQVY
jgi:hypothetical protein